MGKSTISMTIFNSKLLVNCKSSHWMIPTSHYLDLQIEPPEFPGDRGPGRHAQGLPQRLRLGSAPGALRTLRGHPAGAEGRHGRHFLGSSNGGFSIGNINKLAT